MSPSAENDSSGNLAVNSVSYSVNGRVLKKLKRGALVDRGANGGIAGRDMSIVSKSDRTIDLTGLEDHTVGQLHIVHAACVMEAHNGPTIVHLPQQAHMPNGKSIWSALQLEANGCIVQDKAKTLNGGEQPYIQSPDGYKFPLRIRQGLAYAECRPVQDDEWDKLPQTFMTADNDWDPRTFDHEVDSGWNHGESDPVEERFSELPYDRFGNFPVPLDEEEPVTLQEVEAHLTSLIEEELMDSVLEYTIDNQVYHVQLSQEDKDCDWGDWMEVNRTEWRCYDVGGRRRSPRSTDPVSYVPPKRRTRSQGKDPISDEEEYIEPLGEQVPSEGEGGSIETPEMVRRDYNNPAKTFTDNEQSEREAGPYLGKPSKINYDQYAKHFGGIPLKVIEKTFKNTTQLGRVGAVQGLKLWMRHKAPNPALNVFRRHEPVATDTVFSAVPAVFDGSTAAQYFIGRKSGFQAAEGIGTSDKRFVTALQNHIRRYGAMDVLISDNAKAQISTRVEEILNTLVIKHRTSEPHNKNQNFSERGYRDAKRMTNKLLNFSGAPGSCWLLALQYACFILNHTSSERLNGRTPIEWLLGYTPDISPLLQFIFWEPVYYPVVEPAFSADTEEALGRFVGIAETVGHSMTYKILTEEGVVISRATVRTANKKGVFDNKRANQDAPKLSPKEPNANLKVNGESIPVYTVDDDSEDEDIADEDDSSNDVDDISNEDDGRKEETGEAFLRSAMDEFHGPDAALPTIDASDLLSRTFITLPDDDGEQHRAKIEEVTATKDKAADGKEILLRFKCKVGSKRFEEVMTYNRMLEWVDRDMDKDDFYHFEAICGHRRNSKDKNKWDVIVQWKSGEKDWNDLSVIFDSDPVTVSVYAKKHGLLSTPGWKRCKRYVRNGKTLGRAINQVRLKSYRNRPVYKYGFQVPREHREAMLIDERDGNDKWAKSEKLERSQLFDYDTFIDKGLGAPIPEGYKKIPCHFVYDVKHDGRYKSRLVAGGHRTDTPIDSVYSGVVSLRGIRMVTFIAELNGLELWGTDIGNAYLESFTKEKVCFIAGPEFGEYEGHTLVIMKALYGLKSSGKCWHDKLHDVLIAMDFFPSKAEEDIWMRDCGDHYEYIAVYVDDLMIASKNPQGIIDALTSKPNNFKLKGTGPISFHLGCDFFRDEDGVLCIGPRRYIDRMADEYKRMFGSAPKQNIQSPLEKNDHPELDDTELLDADGVSQYQSLIGTLQWTISLGRFDVATAVMTMSGYRVAPRVGHLERVKRICGYLVKFQQGCIRVRTELPDFSDLPDKEYDWARSVYGRVREQKAPGAPVPKGKVVMTTTYKDANLYHDLATGRAVTGVLHFMNQTPIDWFTKKQASVETATYGSEFAAARTAIQQIAAMRLTLQYLGVPIQQSAYLFGDNEAVVTSGTVPHSRLNKRHTALAYHYTREAVASKMVIFHHIPGVINPSDILSKHWGHSQIYPMLRPIMYYHGDTINLLDNELTTPSSKGGEREISPSSECVSQPQG